MVCTLHRLQCKIPNSTNHIFPRLWGRVCTLEDRGGACGNDHFFFGGGGGGGKIEPYLEASPLPLNETLTTGVFPTTINSIC